MTKRVCLDLFSGTGGFSSAFRKSRDWHVIEIDKNESFSPDYAYDLLKVDFEAFNPGAYDVILASPPCKAFSLAAAHKHMTEEVEPKTEFGAESIRLVKRTIGLVEYLDPDYWFIENPRCGLRRVMRKTPWGLGEPTGTVSWCQYGADRMKPTDLWGNHPDSMEYRFCGNGEDCHASAPRGSRTGTQGIETDIKRAAIPFGLSLAILGAVERGL